MYVNRSVINEIEPGLNDKWQRLLANLSELESALVAFSGGVDSSLLCAAAWQALGSRMLAVSIHSPVGVEADMENCCSIARKLGFAHKIVTFDDLSQEDFVANTEKRCYFCKLQRFNYLRKLAHELDFEFVLEGSNAEDLKDYRPGIQAVKELGVLSPLMQAGLMKDEIRALARANGLDNWDRPSQPCLVTRIAYGENINIEKITMISKGEKMLTSKGLNPVRVRLTGSTARIEILPEQFDQLMLERNSIISSMKSFGFTYISLDLMGFRSGSMNEVLGL